MTEDDRITLDLTPTRPFPPPPRMPRLRTTRPPRPSQEPQAPWGHEEHPLSGTTLEDFIGRARIKIGESFDTDADSVPSTDRIAWLPPAPEA